MAAEESSSLLFAQVKMFWLRFVNGISLSRDN